MQAGREIRGRTAINAKSRGGFPCGLLKGLQACFLYGVVRFHILRARLEVPRQGQETCVFAGTVVVTLAGLLTCANQIITCFIVLGHVRAASQIAFGQAKGLQPCCDAFRMPCLSGVGRAGERQVFRSQRCGIGSAGSHQRQRLQHFG